MVPGDLRTGRRAALLIGGNPLAFPGWSQVIEGSQQVLGET